jgi:hypothetical protein
MFGAGRKDLGPSYFVTALVKSDNEIGKFSYQETECPRRTWAILRLFE